MDLPLHRGPVGEPGGGVRLPGLLRKKKSISGFLFGPGDDYDFKSGDHLEL